MTEERRREPDFLIILVTVILICIGLIMVFSSSYVMAEEQLGDRYFYLRRQAMWACLGLAALYIFSRFDYRNLRRLSPLLVLVNFILLTMVFFPGLGVMVQDAQRWIAVGGITVQPSEFTKLALVIFTAAFFSSRSIKMENFWSSSFIPVLIAGLSFLFIVQQPDMGSALVIVTGVGILIFIAGIPMKHLFALGALAVPAFVYLAFSESYRFRRMISFLDPWADPMETGYHVIQSLYALGPGGLFGVGLGQSRQKFYYLPEPHNDFIFSVIGEELGFIGAVTVLLLFFVLLWRGLKIALTVEDVFGSLLAAGITVMLGVQALVNIGVVTGSLPVTGLNLPLISFGGSSLFFTLCGIGILLNLSRHAREQ